MQTNFQFEVIEAELGLVVPRVYREFIDAVHSKQCDLRKYGMHHDTESMLKGNRSIRQLLSGAEPKWEDRYLHFGVSDGCGNYFFLHADHEGDDTVQLWAHDPPGIEDVDTATKFFRDLLAELACGFTGPDKYRFDGSGF